MYSQNLEGHQAIFEGKTTYYIIKRVIDEEAVK